MLVGPVFTREAATLPTRLRLYVSRTIYVAVLLVLMATAWLVLTGTRIVTTVGDLARFGAMLFHVLSPLQLALAVVFSALLAASAVCQEKDRRTLNLLLITRLSNCELVLGKLLASLLSVLIMLAAALPVFMLAALLGGISFQQIAAAFAVTLAGALAAGSLGSTVALWRDKTFQSLAMTALLLAAWLALWEIIAAEVLFTEIWGIRADTWASLFSPWQAIRAAIEPSFDLRLRGLWLPVPVTGFLCASTAAALALNVVAMLGIRVWNPSRESDGGRIEEGSWQSGAWVARANREMSGDDQVSTQVTGTSRRSGKVRRVWDNPVLWRELCTWAYGRKILVVRAAYLLLFVIVAVLLRGIVMAAENNVGSEVPAIIPFEARPLIPLLVVSLLLVNAQAVTSLTTERDGRAIDLLLVTDITPGEFLFGKLGGVLYNTKEMIVLPMLLCGALQYAGRLSGENLFYVLGGVLVLYLFVAMLGIHAGMIYENSRSAIGVSLGTVLFLFLGIATCMRIMIAFSGSFQMQLPPFLAFMLGGGVALYVALGHRNPSSAVFVAAFVAPFATFYVITNFLIGFPLSAFLVTVATYGFATAAMLVPALFEFDVATGRTTADHA